RRYSPTSPGAGSSAPRRAAWRRTATPGTRSPAGSSRSTNASSAAFPTPAREMRFPLPRSRWARPALVAVPLVGAVALVWLRGPNWGTVADAFTVVRWEWVVAAVALNLLSVVARSLAWQTVVRQAVPPPRP